MQVKLHWDIEQAGNHKLIIGNWTEIVRWWNVMVQDRHYKDVVRSDLAEVRSPVITGTKRKAGEELLARRPLMFNSCPTPVSRTLIGTHSYTFRFETI